MKEKLTIDCPAVYLIEVQGYIEENRSDWFDNMTITSRIDPEDRRITRLSGSVLDQAALLGILNKLYNLGLPLLSVSCTLISRQKD